jgi:hypothetical protein
VNPEDIGEAETECRRSRPLSAETLMVQPFPAPSTVKDRRLRR